MFDDTKVGKTLFKFALPAVISLLVLELYNMVDTIFVGRYIGTEAIGGLTVAFPIQRLIIAIAMLISVGASTHVARYLGEKNIESIKRTIVNSLILGIVFILAVTVIVMVFKRNIIMYLGASRAIYGFANSYISIIIIGGIFQCMSTVLCYIMNALGNTKMTLYSNLLGVAINIVMNYILIVLFGFGVWASAVSTVVSQFAAFLYSIYKFVKIKSIFNIKFSYKGIISLYSSKTIFSIISVGLSTFIIEISDAIVSVILNNLLNRNGGDSAIVVVGAITRISMFMYVTIIGISSAMQPIVAYNYGASKYDKIKEVLKITVAAVTITSSTLWVLFMIFANSIIGFFLTDADILKEAVLAFRICISVIPVIGIYYVAIYYYQAIEEAKLSFFFSIYRQLVIFIPAAIVLVQMFGTIGAWFAYPVSDIISFLSSVYFISKEINGEKLAYIYK
ncbi:MATE family efflux transporter [Clostridium sp. 19966]|uniref:MATE family efflux transporter n=1 Tax=Clostridium sp. 19966 TaxID=2768166 RepID=UPI0028DD6F03|nr:MATE family efflux transporter [Clostridium sp. 19966]MDT8715148.1 MATE family efflux transporter [Clostridium sp. 19966]